MLEALRAGRREIRRLRVRRAPRPPELAALVERARSAGIPVQEVEDADLLQLLGTSGNAQGVVLEAEPLPEGGLADLCREKRGGTTLVALDGVNDPQNLGAIARVAEGAGVSGLILTRRNAPPLSPAVARASAGAIEWLPVARVPNLPRALNELKSRGFWVFGCEAGGASSLFELPERITSGDRVVVLGAEGRGLRPGVARVLDHRVSIPMAGRIGSLNVSAAAAVVLFELARRDRLATLPGMS